MTQTVGLSLYGYTIPGKTHNPEDDNQPFIQTSKSCCIVSPRATASLPIELFGRATEILNAHQRTATQSTRDT